MKIRQIRRLRYRLVFAEANKIQTDTDLREWQNLNRLEESLEALTMNGC